MRGGLNCLPLIYNVSCSMGVVKFNWGVNGQNMSEDKKIIYMV